MSQRYFPLTFKQKFPQWQIFSHWPPALNWSASISVGTPSLRPLTWSPRWPSCCPQSQTCCSDELRGRNHCHHRPFLCSSSTFSACLFVTERLVVFFTRLMALFVPLDWESVNHSDPSALKAWRFRANVTELSNTFSEMFRLLFECLSEWGITVAFMCVWTDAHNMTNPYACPSTDNG